MHFKRPLMFHELLFVTLSAQTSSLRPLHGLQRTNVAKYTTQDASGNSHHHHIFAL